MIKKLVFNNSESSYKKLLNSTGCTYNDLETLVRKYGAENALIELANNGMYITLDEFKVQAIEDMKIYYFNSFY